MHWPLACSVLPRCSKMAGAMSEQSPLDRATEFLSDDAADEIRRTEIDALGDRVVEALRTVYDPEIPVNIFELGLVYKIDVDDQNAVHVDMTLTSPMCPVAETLPEEVKTKIEAIDGVTAAEVNVVWDPPWNPSMMTEEAQLELGIIY
jgi:FeS assembly SUF system protein